MGNFIKATFDALSRTYGFLTPELWRETRYSKPPAQVRSLRHSLSGLVCCRGGSGPLLVVGVYLCRAGASCVLTARRCCSAQEFTDFLAAKPKYGKAY